MVRKFIVLAAMLVVASPISLPAASLINIAPRITVAPGESATIPITLASPAPEGGVFVNLNTSDSSVVTINPSLILIRAGETTPVRQPQVSGINFGVASISAGASGFSGDTQIVRVVASLFGATTAVVQQGVTQNFSFSLSAPSPVSVPLSVVSDSPDVAGVPASVSIPANGLGISVPITGIKPGTAVVHIGAVPFVNERILNVTVMGAGTISVAKTVTLPLGSSASYPITLGTPAPIYGLTVSLASNDESKVTISPASAFIEPGQTTPRVQPQITAVDIGAPAITSSAPGYSTATSTVIVSATLTFSPAALTITGNAPQRIVLALSASAPWVTGLTAQLASSNPQVAAVAPSINFYPDGSAFTSVAVYITPVGPGTAVIRASSPPYVPETTATITVSASGGSPAAISVAGGTPQTAAINTAFSSPLSALVKDSGGNLLSGVTVQFQAPAAGPSGAFAAGGNTAITNSLGAATSGVFTANGVAGSYAVTATVAGVAAPATFLLTNSPPTSSTIQLPANVSVSPGQSVAFPVSLSAPATAGGVTIMLDSSDSQKAIISPHVVVIPAGMTAPAAQPSVTGIDFGNVVIAGSASGFASATQSVKIGATLSLQPNTLTVHSGTSQNLTLTLSAPAPAAGVAVALASDNTGVATVLPAVTIAPGTSSISVSITGVSAGSATITAHSVRPNIVDGTASITVTAGADISLASGVTVAPGEWATLAVALAKPAPEGGVFVTLTASDSSVLTVNPVLLLVRAGDTQPARQAQVNGVNFGVATVSATAAGLTGDAQTVRVSASLIGAAAASVQQGSTQNSTFVLTAPTSGAVSLMLTSDNPGIASVPASATIPAGLTALAVPVTGVQPGSTVIHIGAPPAIAQKDLTVTVVSAGLISLPAGLKVPLGLTAPFNVTLGSPASQFGTTVTLASGDPSKVTISPSSVYVAPGLTTPATQPQVTAVDIGIANITASAPGYAQTTAPVEVTATLTFLPAALNIPLGPPGRLVLALSASAPWVTGLTAQLSSSNPAVARVAPSINFYPDGSAFTSVVVFVTPVGSGTTVITASAPPYIDATIATVTVTP